MALVSISTSAQNFANTTYSTWGLTSIDNELFVGSYSYTTKIYVYNITTKALVRTLTVPQLSPSVIGTDGINLLGKNSTGHIMTIDKNDGTVISTKTNVAFTTFNYGTSFIVDTQKDIIYIPTYSPTFEIRRYSTGELLKSINIGGNLSGVTLVNGKFIILTSYSSNKIYLSNDITGLDYSEITFTEKVTYGSSIVGCFYRDGKLYVTTYSTTIISFNVNQYLGEERKTLKELQYGDYIKCKYTAPVSGKMGFYSLLGKSKAQDIPISGSATPDGTFLLVHVGYDYLGRMKLLADRNIQVSISYDEINNNGLVHGNIIKLYRTTNNISANGYANVNESSGVPRFFSAGLLKNIVFESYDTTSVSGTGQLYILSKDHVIKSIHDITLSPVGDNVKNIKTNELNIQVEQDDGFILTNTSTTGLKIAAASTGSGYGWSVSNMYIGGTVPTGTIQLSVIDCTIDVPEFRNIVVEGRLLSGGVTASDKNNEWDKIIIESNLGGVVTPGDANVWNNSTISSWCSNVYTTASTRVIRNTGLSSQATTYTNSTVGYRPILLVEFIKGIKFVLSNRDGYLYNYNTNSEPTLLSKPELTLDNINNNGLDNLKNFKNSDFSSIGNIVKILMLKNGK